MTDELVTELGDTLVLCDWNATVVDDIERAHAVLSVVRARRSSPRQFVARGGGAMVGIVSAASALSVVRDLHHLGLDDLDGVVAPAYDARALLQTLRPARSRAVYVGDMPHDKRCAPGAGYVAVGVVGVYPDAAAPSAAGADCVLGDSEGASVMLQPDSIENEPNRDDSVARRTMWSGDTATSIPGRGDSYTFAILGDRTGLARPGVFEQAVDLVNRLDPDLTVMIGDMIEGYTTDPGELDREWAEFDDLIAPLRSSFFPTAGNHDISNPLMAARYRRKFGNTYHSFSFHDCLFLFLDTQDPPPAPADDVDAFLAEMDRLRALQQIDPVKLAVEISSLQDWESTMPAMISDEQINWAEGVLDAHRDARWTFVFMHMPAWQGAEHPGLAHLRSILGGRPFTMFAGHAHNYERRVIDGRDHIRLGPSGGAFSVVRDHGNFDQVTLVTMADAEPTITSIALHGAFGVEGGKLQPPSWRDPAAGSNG